MNVRPECDLILLIINVFLLVLNRCWYDNADESNRTASDVAAEYIDTSEFPVPDKYKDGDSAEYSTGFFADLYSMRGYIFGFGLGIGLVFSFAYLYFLRIPGLLFTLIWTMLISTSIYIHKITCIYG